MAPANNQKARKKSRKERVISYRAFPKQSGGGLERSAVSSAKSGARNVGVLVGQTKTGRPRIIRYYGHPTLFLDLSSARLQCGQFGFVLEKIAGGASRRRNAWRLEVLPVPAIRLGLNEYHRHSPCSAVTHFSTIVATNRDPAAIATTCCHAR